MIRTRYASTEAGYQCKGCYRQFGPGDPATVLTIGEETFMLCGTCAFKAAPGLAAAGKRAARVLDRRRAAMDAYWARPR